MPKNLEQMQALQTLKENLSRIYEFLGGSSIVKIPGIAEGSSTEDIEATNSSQITNQGNNEETFAQELPELIYMTEIIYMINNIKNGVLEEGLGCRLIYSTKSVELRKNCAPELIPTNLDNLGPIKLNECFVLFLPSDHISFAFRRTNSNGTGEVFAENTITIDETIKRTNHGKMDFASLPNFETARLRTWGTIELRKGALIGIILSKELLRSPKTQILQYKS